MTRIKRLDDLVINQIAAGEVVERPASVLKELVENALDAGATKIRIDLEEGGTKLIAVSDNGSGMEREDAQLAVERHATSKISAAEDLFTIASMGFRGEALASIAAVSRLTLRTCPANGIGTELVIIGGERQPVSDWTREVGTTVVVETLFYNIPARSQFLRKPQTEYAHCLEFVQSLSLANLDVSLSVNHNGKETFAVQADTELAFENKLRQRLAKVLGRDTDDFVWVARSTRFGAVRGLVSPPGRERPNSRAQYFFVNNRWVKDKVLRFAVTRGYHSHLLKGKYPIVVLQLVTDPSLLDVNVHPAKTELRFQYPDEIQNLVAIAIRESLRQGAWARPPSDSDRPSLATDAPSPVLIPPQRHPESGWSLSGPPAGRSSGSNTIRGTGWKRSSLQPIQASAMPAFADLAPPTSPTETIPWSQLTYFGVFAKCYLFFEYNQQMLVVDQHAFHERILFERLSADESLLGRAQPLLMPEEVSLPAQQVAELQELSGVLTKLGFEYHVKDVTSIEVRALPALLTKRDPDELFSALSAGSARDFTLDSNAGVNQHLLATMACHAAVKAGEELPEQELRQLLAEASTVNFFHNCPHGRRVFRWWKVSQVAAWFDR